MTVNPPHDEFRERARRAAEAREIADGYAGALRRRALRAFLIAAWCVVLMWLAWEIATWPLPGFIERSPIVEELREHGGR
jgi:hypothetical protein